MASLGEKLSDLINPAPTSLEPEDIDFYTKAKVVDKYVEDIPVSQSQLRKKNIQLTLGSKYAGKKVSRKKLLEESSESVSDDDDDDNVKIENNSSKEISLSSEDSCDYTSNDDIRSSEDHEKAHNNLTDEDNKSDKNIEYDDDDNENDESEKSGDDTSEDDDEDNEMDMVQKFSNIDVGEEIEKGKAVKCQLSLWDCFLECRIKLQKLLLIANKLPQPDTFNSFCEEGNSEYNNFTKQGDTSIKKLLDLLIDVQTELLQRNSETRCVLDDQLHQKIKTSDDEISESSEEEDEDDKIFQPAVKRKLTIEEYPEFLNKRHKNFISFRNSTIQKWNEKTKVASNKLNKNSFTAFEQSTLKQIEQILSDKARLISRTQLKRSSYRILGKEKQNKEMAVSQSGEEKVSSEDQHLKDYEYDVEIFDDDDFYHHLLREIIERKTIDINDPIALSRQWLEIQKLRSKMKKKVDTKASKGRKIRFGVHPKMVNFMAPVDNCTMSDEAK